MCLREFACVLVAAFHSGYPCGKTSDTPVVSMYVIYMYTYAIGSVLRLPYAILMALFLPTSMIGVTQY